MWEKAVADGDVEQMFGMNIKQEGIEVQGDQVRIPNHNLNNVVSCRRTRDHPNLTITGRFRTLDPRLASYP
jgi:hypothetical protein